MSGGNTISLNNVTDGSQGITLYKSINNTISGNNIMRNEIGLELGSSTFNNITKTEYKITTMEVMLLILIVII